MSLMSKRSTQPETPRKRLILAEAELFEHAPHGLHRQGRNGGRLGKSLQDRAEFRRKARFFAHDGGLWNSDRKDDCVGIGCEARRRLTRLGQGPLALLLPRCTIGIAPRAVKRGGGWRAKRNLR